MGGVVFYPSNWLYNAGVVGFLRVLEECGKDVDDFLKEDGSVEIKTLNLTGEEILEKWKELLLDTAFNYGSQKAYFSNQTEGSIKRTIQSLLSSFGDEERGLRRRKRKEYRCIFCGRLDVEGRNKEAGDFLRSSYSNRLLSSGRTFPNIYWNLSPSDFICSKCRFILFSHPLGFTETLNRDGYIFINSLSFKVMYYLNRYARTLFPYISSRKRLLAMSLIEHVLRVEQELHRWLTMNVEMVIVSSNGIRYVSLPERVLKLLLDYRISSLLKDIGELSVIDKLINEEFNALEEMSYKLMREALIIRDRQELSEKNSYFNNFYTLKSKSLSKKKRYELAIELAQKIAELRGLISQVLDEPIRR